MNGSIKDWNRPKDATPDAKAGRDTHADLHPRWAIRLERAGIRPSVVYGNMIGAPCWFERVTGPDGKLCQAVQFIFDAPHAVGFRDWQMGPWMVTIYGADLEKVYNCMTESKEAFVKEGTDTVTAFEIERAKIRDAGEE